MRGAESITYMGVHCPTCASKCDRHGPDERCKGCDCIPLPSGRCAFCNTQVADAEKVEDAA